MLPLVVPLTIKFKGNKFFSVIQTKCWCTKAWKSCFAKRALLQHLGATLRGTSCNAWCPLGVEEACRGGGGGGSQKCFSERANGFAAAPVTGTATHKKRVKRVLLNTASAWNEKTKKRNNFDLTLLPRHVWSRGSYITSWGNYIFHISRSDQGGMTVDWSLLPSFLPIITPSLVTQHHQLIPCNHNLAT